MKDSCEVQTSLHYEDAWWRALWPLWTFSALSANVIFLMAKASFQYISILFTSPHGLVNFTLLHLVIVDSPQAWSLQINKWTDYWIGNLWRSCEADWILHLVLFLLVLSIKSLIQHSSSCYNVWIHIYSMVPPQLPLSPLQHVLSEH